MRKVAVRISDGEQEFTYSVSPEVAGALVRQLNEAVFPSAASLDKPQMPFDFTSISRTYRELAKHLYACEETTICLTFSQIEEIIGRPLPPSARKHSAWWANARSHPYSAAWMAVGRQTCELDLAAETIAFQKK